MTQIGTGEYRYEVVRDFFKSPDGEPFGLISRVVADADPEAKETLSRALKHLAPEFREVIVLRELEGLSYKEIGDVAGVPVGTVMSRLSRARAQLQRALRKED